MAIGVDKITGQRVTVCVTQISTNRPDQGPLERRIFRDDEVVNISNKSHVRQLKMIRQLASAFTMQPGAPPLPIKELTQVSICLLIRVGAQGAVKTFLLLRTQEQEEERNRALKNRSLSHHKRPRTQVNYPPPPPPPPSPSPFSLSLTRVPLFKNRFLTLQ